PSSSGTGGSATPGAPPTTASWRPQALRTSRSRGGSSSRLGEGSSPPSVRAAGRSLWSRLGSLTEAWKSAKGRHVPSSRSSGRGPGRNDSGGRRGMAPGFVGEGLVHRLVVSGRLVREDAVQVRFVGRPAGDPPVSDGQQGSGCEQARLEPWLAAP